MAKKKKDSNFGFIFGIVVICLIFLTMIFLIYAVYSEKLKPTITENSIRECYGKITNEWDNINLSPSVVFCECMDGKASPYIDSNGHVQGQCDNEDLWDYFCRLNPTESKYGGCLSR